MSQEKKLTYLEQSGNNQMTTLLFPLMTSPFQCVEILSILEDLSP